MTMTVENTKYMDFVTNENEAGCFDNENEQNNENMHPLSGELMVAIRSNYNIPLISKININKPKEIKEKVEKEVLSNTKNVKRASTIETTRKPVITINVLNSCPLNTSSSLIHQLSHSADSNNLQSALKQVQDNLTQSCFAELTSEKKYSDIDIDSELTCLNWLQESNLLKEFSPGEKKSDSSEQEAKADTISIGANPDLKLNSQDPLGAINDVDKSQRKPAYSFSTLIFMAIESSPNKRLPVKDIYQWIQDNFPYFQRAPIGWKNSIRHNLSLNKSFKKVDKEKCIGKGSLWMIDHQARAGLVQQLRKTSMCNSYPYSKPTYSNGCGRYFLKDKKLHRRDATGRFVPNHDDAEFDVAAAMCSLSSAALIDYQNKCSQSNGFDYVTSEALLQIWRTYIEPNDEYDDSSVNESDSFMQNHRSRLETSKYSVKDFLDEVHSKLSLKSRHNFATRPNQNLDSSLNISMDEDYEFDRSDDESSDEEMRENMLRLVEKENDECLADSGYSEEGTLKTSTMLDHSYSKSIQSLVRPHSRRESKGVDALLHLANAATRELENLSNLSKISLKMNHSSNSTTDLDFTNLHCTESSAVFTAEKSCQFDSSATVTMS